MSVAFNYLAADGCIGNPVGRIEHTDFKQYRKQAGEGNIDIPFGHKPPVDSLFQQLV
ncbi:hypothetical protein SDC9_180215 [bioreactor metagenome]|uniref:Uncharacterized protein n=1 Tax=bioreactor metagenome TaxID=1076179 RepID=A0A645H122_9ZZZZ